MEVVEQGLINLRFISMMAGKRRKPTSAAELMAKLKSDTDYKARVAERDRKIEERAAVERTEEEDLVSELREAGLDVGSVWNLVNTPAPYPTAIPILLEHLRRDYSDRTKEGIARALAVPEARVGWSLLVTEFKQSKDTTTIGLKWALACALGAAGDDAALDDAVAIMKDTQHGQNRLPLLAILERSKTPSATEMLGDLLDDNDLAEDARKLLSKRRH